MGEAAFAARVDQHGGRAGGQRGVRLDRRCVDALGREPRTDDAAPEIVSDQARGSHAKPEPLHGGARVADDSTGGHFDRLDVKKTPATDRLREWNWSDEDVGHARAADDAIDRVAVG